MLTEIILGKATGDVALATALDFVRAIRKTPIVVNDSRGFFANRCVLNYIQEGHLMFAEGVPAPMIETVARMAGMPVGPLSLNDEVALDLGWKILKATEADLGPKAINPQQKWLLQELVEKRERLGRKNGKGFYDYPQGAPKRLWPGLADLQKKTLDPDKIESRARTGCGGSRSNCALRGGVIPMCGGRRRLDPRLRFLRRSPAAALLLDSGNQAFRRSLKLEEIRPPLPAAQAPDRHGAERRHLLRPVRAGRRPGGLSRTRPANL
jgi:hypothetical protein